MKNEFYVIDSERCILTIRRFNALSKFQIWIEGWSATGGGSDATFIGEIEAPDFITACRTVRYNEDYHYTPAIGKLLSESETYKETENGIYDWACKLFDNEEDARKSFG